MACTISKDEIARVKGFGFLNNPEPKTISATTKATTTQATMDNKYTYMYPSPDEYLSLDITNLR